MIVEKNVMAVKLSLKSRKFSEMKLYKPYSIKAQSAMINQKAKLWNALSSLNGQMHTSFKSSFGNHRHIFTESLVSSTFLEIPKKRHFS